jgi:hypothetical protein
VRFESDLWRAHFESGHDSGKKRRHQGREQLTIAANGSDAEVRAQALEVLQKLGP